MDEVGGSRRLRLVTHYPAATSEGPRSAYVERGEYAAVVVPLLDTFGLPAEAFGSLAAAEIASVDGVAAAPGRHPVVIFSPGGPSWPTQNTALAEELASHGFVVCSVGRPGLSSGVRFADGTVAAMRPDFAAAMEEFEASDFVDQATAAVERRHELYLEAASSSLARFQAAVRDDARTAADAVLSGAVGRSVGLPGDLATDRLIYAGHSLGGSASVSAADNDVRAVAAVNIDGLHFSLDLHNRTASVRVLDITADPQLTPFGAWSLNSFCFEPHDTIGDETRVVRIFVDGATHLDFMDAAMLPPGERSNVSPCLVDGPELMRALGRLIRQFSHGETLELDGFTPYDLSAARRWAAQER